jgi:hypothetical protein
MIVFHGFNTVIGEGSLDTPLLPGPYGAPSLLPPHGTLLLARDSFLERQILNPLAKVNALSTILCKFKGVDKTHWDLTLETWQNDPMKSDSADDCRWDVDTSSGEGLRYKWEYVEELRYEADGRANRDGSYLMTSKILSFGVYLALMLRQPRLITILLFPLRQRRDLWKFL